MMENFSFSIRYFLGNFSLLSPFDISVIKAEQITRSQLYSSYNKSMSLDVSVYHCIDNIIFLLCLLDLFEKWFLL